MQVAEEWAGTALIPNTVYGPRVYANGSTLSSHTDRYRTHTHSAHTALPGPPLAGLGWAGLDSHDTVT